MGKLRKKCDCALSSLPGGGPLFSRNAPKAQKSGTERPLKGAPPLSSSPKRPQSGFSRLIAAPPPPLLSAGPSRVAICGFADPTLGNGDCLCAAGGEEPSVRPGHSVGPSAWQRGVPVALHLHSRPVGFDDAAEDAWRGKALLKSLGTLSPPLPPYRLLNGTESGWNKKPNNFLPRQSGPFVFQTTPNEPERDDGFELWK